MASASMRCCFVLHWRGCSLRDCRVAVSARTLVFGMLNYFSSFLQRAPVREARRAIYEPMVDRKWIAIRVHCATSAI